MALSNTLTGIVNLITFLLSIPLIGAGIWLATKLDTECVRFLEWPIILIGVIVLLVSLAGFIGAFWRVTWLLWIYLLVMFLIILVLLVFIIFAFVVTKNGAGANQEFRLGDYSTWLRRQVESGDNWRKITSCIKDAKVCNALDAKYKTYADFSTAHLSPLQSGCCKPPTICGYSYVNATFWINPTNLYADSDCVGWRDDQSELCYECDSCRAGVLANVKQGWRKVAVLSVAVLIGLIVVYIIGCCAFHNAQTQDLFKRYEEGYTGGRRTRRRRFSRW